MDNRKDMNHPDIETLAGYDSGLIDGDENERIKVHLEGCALCRLEIKKMKRFSVIDSDAYLQDEAEWDRAGAEMEKFFRDRVLPGAVSGSGLKAAGKIKEHLSGKRWYLGWMVPVAAAAAVLVLIFAVVGRRPGTVEPDPSHGPLRGDIVEERKVELKAPAGDVDSVPELFEWSVKEDFEYYTLEIFKADLTEVFMQQKISNTSFAVPDSVGSLFDAGEMYFWNIRAYMGVKRAAVSSNGWFRIVRVSPPGK